MLRENDLLGPLERLSVLIVCRDEGVDLVANLPRRGEAGAGQGFAGENREPDFDLVQPRGMGRSEVKVDVGVSGQPAIVFGLVGVQVVQDDMSLLAGIGGDGAVHEVQELDPSTAPVMATPDQAGSDVQGGERVVVPWRMYSWLNPVSTFAIGQFQAALGALQGLDVRLFVDRQHHRILRRLQTEPDNVRRLLRETEIGADAPAATPRQRDLVPAQHAPDLMLGDVAQMLRQ